MNLKELKDKIFIFLVIFLLSGCTVTYNLDISNNNIYESITINATTSDKVSFFNNVYEHSNEIAIDINKSNYFICAYWSKIDDEMCGIYVNQKFDGVEYYNNIVNEEDINFDYKFTVDDFDDSNTINSFYSTFIFKQYDYNEDGKEDYYILSTTDDFSAFDLYNQLTEVTIKITNNHEVISSNADEVDGNIYIWHFTPNKTSSINMIYNPDVIVDNRTIWEKIKDGDYTNIFTISILVFVIGIIIYIIIKRKGDKKNKI